MTQASIPVSATGATRTAAASQARPAAARPATATAAVSAVTAAATASSVSAATATSPTQHRPVHAHGLAHSGLRVSGHDQAKTRTHRGQTAHHNEAIRARKRVATIIGSLFLAVIAIAFLLPMLWLFIAAFNEHATLSITDLGFSTENFSKVLTWDVFGGPVVNSLILSLGTAVCTVVCAVLAAYPLARFKTRASSRTLNIILFASCLPITSLMVPVYGIFVQIGIIDSMVGAILFMTACGLPMGIFMMRNFVASIPPDLEEAAWVDGASRLKALRYIVVPLMMPSILVIFISEFAGTWGNFFVPFMLLMSPEKEPAAVSIYTFFGQHGSVAYGQLAAFSLLYSIPIVILYVITESKLGNSSLMAGSVKG